MTDDSCCICDDLLNMEARVLKIFGRSICRRCEIIIVNTNTADIRYDIIKDRIKAAIR